MFTRIWRTGFDAGRRSELEGFAREISAPMFRSLPGCTGYLYAVRENQWITQTFWESAAHIAEAEASDVYKEVVDRILAAGFLGREQSTEVFEVITFAGPVA